MIMAESNRPIIFFDGVCNLCSRFIDFIARHDSAGRFRFASLQGETAARKLSGLVDDRGDPQTVVLLDGDSTYRRSDAVLRVMVQLDSPSRLLGYAGFFFPRFVRDRVYALVARKRYGWFGKKDSCRVPTPEESTRFLP